jgi:hypothetical protein
MKKISFSALFTTALLVPSIASAAGGVNNITDLIRYILSFVNLLIPLVGSLALLAFLKGLATFISKSGDVKSQQDGKDLMLYGVIALFVMVAFLGILTILKSDLGLNTTTGIPNLHRSQ